MNTPNKRTRRKKAGFIGIKIVKSSDMTIFDKLEQAVAADPEMNRSKLVRLALKEYFERREQT